MNELMINDFTEKNLSAIAESICHEVEEGNKPALEVYIQAKALSKISEKIIDRLKREATNGAEQYAKMERVFKGAEFNLSTSPLVLNYEEDPEYLRLSEQLKARKKLLSDSYKQAQNGTQLITDQGELIPVVSKKKEQETIITVSFKKR